MSDTLDPEAKVIGRRERNKLDKQRRIIAAARELFHSKGYELTTTQEVADRAGVGAGTLFLYVSTKEDLLILAFVDEIIEVVDRAFRELDQTAAYPEQICAYFYRLLDYHNADIVLSQYLIREVAVVRNRERADQLKRLPILSHLVAITRGAQARGEIRSDTPAEQIGVLMFASYWDCLREWINSGTEASRLRERLLRMVRLQVEGLGGSTRERQAKTL